MYKPLKIILNKLFFYFGYKISKSNSKFYGLRDEKFDLIIDVGANIGDVSKFFLETYQSANVYAFEPNNRHHRVLKDIEAKYNGRFFPIFKGVGSQNTTISLNIHKEHDASSSFLKLNTLGAEELNKFTNVDVTNQEMLDVSVITLDNYFKDLILAEHKILLKSDTQGFELEVLKGGENILKQVNTVMVEVDFFNFYENQGNALEIINYLYARDFILTGFTYPPGVNKKGEILATDFIFRKSSTRN